MEGGMAMRAGNLQALLYSLQEEDDEAISEQAYKAFGVRGEQMARAGE
jgi:hypothetical protein